MRILLVGLGSIGRRHLANLRELQPNAEIAVLRSGMNGKDGIVPPDADRVFFDIGEAAAFGAKCAFICTPSPFHVEAALRLIESGSHIFIEKPIAAEADGVAELLECADSRRRIVMVGYNLIFTEPLICLKAALAGGRIGRPLLARAEVGQYLPDWRPGSDYRSGTSAQANLGGGALLELSHEIHYLMWLLGEVSSVQAWIARTGTLEVDVEDLALLHLGFRSGVIADVQLDFLQRTYSRTCKVIGTEGALVWDPQSAVTRFYPPGETTGVELCTPVETDRNAAYRSEIAHFLDCLDTGRKPFVSGREALEVLRVVAAAREGARSGSIVRL